MAKTYRVTFFLSLVNHAARMLLRAGIKIHTVSLLTVRGRKSGQLHTIPVTLVEQDNQRWLVAPYGPVNWVKNLRVAGSATLERGKRSEIISVREVEPEAAAPVLKQYINRISFVRPYFTVKRDSSLQEFVKEAPEHPVFLVIAGN